MSDETGKQRIERFIKSEDDGCKCRGRLWCEPCIGGFLVMAIAIEREGCAEDVEAAFDVDEDVAATDVIRARTWGAPP